MSLGMHAFLDEVDPKVLEKVTKFDPSANLVFEKFPPVTWGQNRAKCAVSFLSFRRNHPKVFRKKLDFLSAEDQSQISHLK